MVLMITARMNSDRSRGRARISLRAAACTECPPYLPGRSILVRCPPNGLAEDLLVIGVLVGEMVVAGLNIDHSRALVSLGPGDDFVALGFIRGQQWMAFPGHVDP